MSRDFKELVASPAGLEPATHSLGNCCSILLSYGDVGKIKRLLVGSSYHSYSLATI